MAHESASADVIVGRSDERARLAGLLDVARDGLSAALVLHGEAGMGKTTLLDDLVGAAPDFGLLRVSGVESEMDLGFAALHRLLGPYLSSLGALPQPQREAVESSFGLRPGPAPDRFLVGLAVLTLLSDAAASEPLLCTVDDAQWVDPESLAALSFVGRRLLADRVVLVLAFRDPPGGSAELPDGLPTLHVAGLPESDALTLLGSLAPVPLHQDVARRISLETEGSPLAIVELLGELSEEQLSGGGLLPDPLPIGTRLERHFLRLSRELPAGTQTILLLAAAEDSDDPVLLRRAAVVLGLAPEDGDPAEAAGLVQLAPRVAFRHPLIRSAIYGGAPAPDRRRVHWALAASTDRGERPDRWAWHAAEASVEPDEEIAAELARSADVARERGGFAAETKFLRRAAEMTVDPLHRAALQLRAAKASLTAGAPRAASALLEQATPFLSDVALRVEADRLAAAMQAFTWPGRVPEILLSAARAIESHDPDTARETYAEAVQACMISCQYTIGTTPEAVARAALAMARVGEHGPSIADLLLDAFATRFADGYAAAVPRMRVALERLASSLDPSDGYQRWTVLANNLPAELWEADRTRALLDAMEQSERDRGALESLRITLGAIAHTEMWNGRFGAADACHSEAREISVAMGADAMRWEVLKVELLAWQGREAEALAFAGILTGDLAVASGSGIAVNMGNMALTVLALGQGRYRDAFDAASRVYEVDFPPQGNQILPSVVEAGVRCGETTVAEDALSRLEARATVAATPWALGLLARSRALLATDAEAESHYEEALALLGNASVATELARSHLLYGEWLRRQKRRIDAREQLRTALGMFESMGAAAFAERARTELAATGERARKRSLDTALDLTPQETQIAVLAAGGATNGEIATKLFLSSSTVDYHLRKVFRKLDVTSRRELSGGLRAREYSPEAVW